ncbi:hypothetical protein BJ742DRAFT_505178 [Cladochytrium replicatum]|nr:hypothetical protein BJ742DRAFT_505178 [Cladochytrium replicatum]
MSYQRNVLGQPLQPCSFKPLTGYLRDGHCTTTPTDSRTHLICAEMTQSFLQFTKSKGNDLAASFASFPGLKPGDRWCLCAGRWMQAYQAGKEFVPPVVMEATNERVVEVGVPVDTLKKQELI